MRKQAWHKKDKGKSIAVVGGGLFGLHSARFLAQLGYEVTIFESESEVMQKASLFNQARVHGGYHYPRSLSTGARSRENYLRFIEDFKDAIYNNFEAYYAIAQGSKVSSFKFERFMKLINAPYKKISTSILFNPNLIDSTYLVEETAFDAKIVREILVSDLYSLGVELKTSTSVGAIGYANVQDSQIVLELDAGHSSVFDGLLIAGYGLDTIRNNPLQNLGLVYEVCELVKIESEGLISDKAITVMDGPYWSLTPWPAFGAHVLTHVRHTPHARFNNSEDAIDFLRQRISPRAEVIIRDAARYSPWLQKVTPIESAFVIKTILAKREEDDGRPILLARKDNILSIVGSKLDNVYDIDDQLEKFADSL